MVKIKNAVIGVLCGLSIATTGYAAVPGPYAGAQAGWGNLHRSVSASRFSEATGIPVENLDVSNRDKGLAGRVFIGYEMHPAFAVELGYTRFTNAKIHINLTAPVGTLDAAVIDDVVKVDAVDLVAKGILPPRNGFSIYGKLGGAYLRGREDFIGSAAYSGGSYTKTVTDNDTEHKVYPTFGLGISYELTRNVVADLSWNRIQKVGSSSMLKSTDFAALGLAYHFG